MGRMKEISIEKEFIMDVDGWILMFKPYELQGIMDYIDSNWHQQWPDEYSAARFYIGTERFNDAVDTYFTG